MSPGMAGVGLYRGHVTGLTQGKTPPSYLKTYLF